MSKHAYYAFRKPSVPAYFTTELENIPCLLFARQLKEAIRSIHNLCIVYIVACKIAHMKVVHQFTSLVALASNIYVMAAINICSGRAIRVAILEHVRVQLDKFYKDLLYI